MRISDTQIVRALSELLKEGKLEEGHLRENIVGFLKKKRLFGNSRKIVTALEREIDMLENRVRVTVLSARQLDEEERKTVSHRTHEIFPGKKILLTYREQPSLIGGIAFETDDVRYDATLARSLKLLSQSL